MSVSYTRLTIAEREEISIQLAMGNSCSASTISRELARNSGTTGYRAVAAQKKAARRYGTPEIFNTDQGSQFTSLAFTDLLKTNDIRISMDGKGCWRDNVFVELQWRSIKSEEVYLKAYESVSQARASTGRYLRFYNSGRPHSSLDRQTPDQVYFNALPLPRVA